MKPLGCLLGLTLGILVLSPSQGFTQYDLTICGDCSVDPCLGKKIGEACEGFPVGRICDPSRLFEECGFDPPWCSHRPYPIAGLSLAPVWCRYLCECRVGASDEEKPDISIPDGDPGGITVDIPLPPDWPGPCPGPFAGDLTIEIAFDHTSIGDLTVILSHGTTQITLMDRPGRTDSGDGCDADLHCEHPIYFGDNAIQTIECGTLTMCPGCFPEGEVPSGGYQPDEPLSAFRGQPLGGQWQLFVSDNAQGDTGKLCSVRLIGICEISVPVEQSTWGMIKALYE
ncbi:MAG: hypothetical protein JSW58_15645 [Candidatus Latescibacterota bacterium]|nr:MAG: hypothetical protein JSW58_15645 [Candidatus Latescibacterota bacterium]